MTIEAVQHTIKVLFEQASVFEVPKYQRSYAWETEQIADFEFDIRSCLNARIDGEQKRHFFGGVVCARFPMSNSTTMKYEVIDGQQRLSSFVLLATVLVKLMNDISSEINLDSASNEDKMAKKYFETTVDEISSVFLKFKHFDGAEYTYIPKIRLSVADNEFFQEAVSWKESPAQRESHNRILKVRESLQKFVESLISKEETASGKVFILKSLYNDVLTSDCNAIFMWSDDRMEAYRIFQVLNDRGARLRDGDLLRARTLEMLDNRKFENQQNEVAAQWDEILRYSPKSIDDYLLWYYSSHQGERPKISEVTNQFMKKRFNQSSDLIANSREQANNAVSEVKQMRQDFETLEQLVNSEWPYDDEVGVNKWDVFRLDLLVGYLKQTSVLPLLLALTLLEPRSFAEALTSIERFIFRYKTIVNAHIGRATNVFHAQAKKIRDNPNGYKVAQLRKELQILTKDYASDSVFMAKIEDLTYDNNRRDINYMLLTVEDYYDWLTRGGTGTPVCKDKSQVLDIKSTTVEHIYPQNPRVVDAELEELVHAIGNLALLGPGDNAALGNKSFSDKRSTFQGSNLRLNRLIGNGRAWTSKDVKSRTTMLAQTAAKIFIP